MKGNSFYGNQGYGGFSRKENVKIPLSDTAAEILRMAHDRVPDEAFYIVKGSLVRLGKSDANGFRNKEEAGKEIAQILGAISYALYDDFDPETNISYREKYPLANTHLRNAFMQMLNKKEVSRDALHELIEEIESQCSNYEIKFPKGRGRAG